MAEIEVMTTLFQHPIRVDEAEAEVLRSQGLIAADPPAAAPDGAPADDDAAEPDPAADDKPDTKES